MSFDATQKANIRFYLGYQDQFRDVNTSLESQMSAGAISAEAVTIVVGILASLAQVDADLIAARKRLKASKVGSIMLNSRELDMLKGEGGRFVGRLASIFGVRPLRDIYREDGSMGGVIPLG